MKTTAKHFKLFKAEALRTADVLGLHDWEFRLYHNDTRKDCLAHYSLLHEGKAADITLTREWQDMPITNEAIKSAARHEVLHILLADLVYLAHARQTGEHDIETAEHAIIHRLERLL